MELDEVNVIMRRYSGEPVKPIPKLRILFDMTALTQHLLLAYLDKLNESNAQERVVFETMISGLRRLEEEEEEEEPHQHKKRHGVHPHTHTHKKRHEIHTPKKEGHRDHTHTKKRHGVHKKKKKSVRK